MKKSRYDRYTHFLHALTNCNGFFFKSNRPTPTQAPPSTSPLRLGTENRPPARPSSSSTPTAVKFTFYPPQQQVPTPQVPSLDHHHISHGPSENSWQPPTQCYNAFLTSSAPVYPSQPHDPSYAPILLLTTFQPLYYLPIPLCYILLPPPPSLLVL